MASNMSQKAFGSDVAEYCVAAGIISQAQFEEALLNEGVTYADFRMKIDAQVRDALIYSKVKQKKQQEFVARAVVADREIERYYRENKGEFKVDDRMNLLQIYIDKAAAGPDAPERIKAAARAGGIESAVESVPFTDGIRYVELGWIDTSQMSREIRAALARPRKGALVGPVETEDAWHIFKIVDYSEGRVRELADVRERVRIRVIENKVEKMWNTWVEQVKEKALIRYM